MKVMIGCKHKDLTTTKHTCPIEEYILQNPEPYCKCCEECWDQCKTDVLEQLHGQYYIKKELD